MSFGLTDHVRARTRAARAGAGWWRAVFGVASVAIALLLGLPVAATASEQPLGSPPASPDGRAAQQPSEGQSAPEPAASRDDGAVQRPTEGQSVSEPGIGGDDQAADAVEFGDEEAGGRAPRGEVAAAASVPRLTRGSRGDVEAGDPAAPQEQSDAGARAAAWQARAASSGTAAASERSSQVVNDSDDAHEDAAAAGERADDEDDAAARDRADDDAARDRADDEDAGERAHDEDAAASDEEATPVAPRFEGSVAAAPALRQRAAALPWRADRDARRTTTPGRTSRFASAQRASLSGASTATLATQITTPATTAVMTARGSVRTRPSEPDKQGHARASTRQRTAPMPPPSRRGAETTTTGTVASGSGAGAFGASPVTGGLVALMLATSAIWFVLRERAHRMRSLVWAAPLERPG